MNHKKAVDKRLIRGRSIEQGVAAASLYAACRRCGVPRTLDEIGQASRTGRKEIGRTYRFMVRELKMKIMPTGPEDYISRFCSGLTRRWRGGQSLRADQGRSGKRIDQRARANRYCSLHYFHIKPSVVRKAQNAAQVGRTLQAD